MTRTCNARFVAINTGRTVARTRAWYRNWHLLSNDKLLPVDTFIFRRSVAVWSSFARYRTEYVLLYREQINSLSAVHASVRQFARAWERDAWYCGRSIFRVCARWSRLASIVNRNEPTVQTVRRVDEPITPKCPLWTFSRARRELIVASIFFVPLRVYMYITYRANFYSVYVHAAPILP